MAHSAALMSMAVSPLFNSTNEGILRKVVSARSGFRLRQLGFNLLDRRQCSFELGREFLKATELRDAEAPNSTRVGRP